MFHIFCSFVNNIKIVAIEIGTILILYSWVFLSHGSLPLTQVNVYHGVRNTEIEYEFWRLYLAADVLSYLCINMIE